MFGYSQDRGQFGGRNPWAPARTRPAADKKPLGTAGKRLGSRPSPAACAGFSLIELLVSMAVLLVILGGIVSAISTSQQAYGRTELKSDMYENVRGVAELMAQEIGQAGLLNLPAAPIPTLNAIVVPSGLAQTVNVTPSTASMFVGEQLLVDTGNSEELLVNVTGVAPTSITAIFGKPHLVGAPINVMGVSPNGIVAPGTPDASTGTVLNIFGDINGDGSLVYVRYTCNPGIPAAPGTLTRSVTTITPGVNALNASQNLLTTVVANPGGTPCFQYATQVPVAGFASPIVTNVGITLTVQTTAPDPQTHQYLTMTKSFLNLAPRNLMTGMELANTNITNRLQPTPANVLVY